VVATGLCGLLLGGFAAQAAPAIPPLRIVGGLGDLNQYTQIEEPFWTQRLPQLSEGRYRAEIQPFDKAGIRGQDVLSLVQQGALPFGTVLLSQGSAKAPELGAPDLAGLNPNMTALRRTLAAYRPYLQKRLHDRLGVELLAIYTYPAQVIFCKQPWRLETGLAGRRVRTASSTQSDFVLALGGTPVLIPFSEVVAQIRGPNLDCAITAAMSGNTVGLHQYTGYLSPIAVTWGLSIFVANAAAWAALPADLQTLLRRELKTLEATVWDAADRETQEGIACNAGTPQCKHGRPGKMVVLAAGPQDEQRRRDVLAQDVLSRWRQRCGAECTEVWDRILSKESGLGPVRP
jgi:TRAP-type C4-dicarboxylate transport system substrate-binding protein